MFVTMLQRAYIQICHCVKPFISYKSGNIIAFIDNLMNSYLYGNRYDEISDIAYNALNGKSYLAKMDVEALIDCNIFAGVDN